MQFYLSMFEEVGFNQDRFLHHNQRLLGLGAPIAFDVAVRLRTLERPFKNTRGAPRDDGPYRRVCLAQQGIAHSGVEESIVAGDGLDRLRPHAAVCIDAESAPMIGWFLAPLRRLNACDFCECFFLDVESPFPVVSLGAAEMIPWPGQRRKVVCAQCDRGAGEVMEPNRERIICAFPVSFAKHFGADGFRQTEKSERLIDEMSAEVKQNAALFRVFLPLTGGGAGTPAVQGGLEVDWLAERFFMKHIFNCQEVAIPAAIMKWNELQADAARQLHQLGDLSGRHSHWLVDDNVLRGFESF